MTAASTGVIDAFRGLTKPQKTAIWASYLGWTLDAFDYFLMVFMLKAISQEFGTGIEDVSEALFLTLAARPLGALVFGWLGDRFGRRPVLMTVIALFSVLSGLSGIAGSLSQLLLIRACFGFAMGGEWGLGASLVMETIPARLRGPVSGLLQAGYSTGYLVASLVYFLFFDALGWRAMFFIGIVPALFVLFIRAHVEESPTFTARLGQIQQGQARQGVLKVVAQNWRLALYLIVLMTGMNFLSHGTQDLYPTFLQKQHGFDTHTTGTLAIVLNIGSIVGSLGFGTLSERLGRRRTLALACLIVVPVIPLWAYSTSLLPLGAGAFLIGLSVQGAWANIPAYLNELSPPAIRAMFPGLVYQLGNLIASRVSPLQAGIAESHGGSYGYALASVTLVTAVALIGWISFGPEKRDALD
ncbi:MAG: MFS transporter [Candidatus Andeanibacterium colombiense]|uniref:MFS transporter n=1 Tax=Candidatus Andeanibacterium colombiense TaxID=3121345 RepID=A0AAJ5X8V4_9SPHN|nr:MAG: MFS transporter [Sphingomonadaceae bacterium]